MTKTSTFGKQLIILSFLGFIFVGLLLNEPVNKVDKNSNPINNFELINLPRSQYLVRGPISISGNSAFTSINGVTGGSGTENDPYIIENYEISANGSHAVQISSTSAYFVIRNCYFRDGNISSYYGVYLNGVTNARIENSTFIWNYNGIRMASTSTGNTIFNCTFLYSTEIALNLPGGSFSDTKILNCTFKYNNGGSSGCINFGSARLTIKFNYFMNNSNYIIQGWAGSDDTIVSNNIFINNTGECIHYGWGQRWRVENNLCIDSDHFLYLDNGDYGEIRYNIVKGINRMPGMAIYFWATSYNTIENNTFSHLTTIMQWNTWASNPTQTQNVIRYNELSNSTNGIIISVTEPANNYIYWNNFRNITVRAATLNGNNYWDYQNKGNYWDNYTGVDNNADGIGDTAYLISGGLDNDNYPLMYPVNLSLSLEKIIPYATFLFKWGSDGTEIGKFKSPFGLTIDKNNNIYVADRVNARINIFSPNDTLIRTFGESGTGNGQFNYPMFVAVNESLYIYVADYNNRRIQVFYPNGTFFFKWGTGGTADGQFGYPYGLTINQTGYIYVADAGTSTDRIQVFDCMGNFIMKFGSHGSGDGQFSCPTALYVNNSGYVYVADYDNNRVQVFYPNGSYYFKWGSAGSGIGQFNVIEGITLSPNGLLFISEHNNHRIQVFYPNGTYYNKWGSYGSDNGQFYAPAGICFNQSGHLYISDTGNTRVQVFAIENITQPTDEPSLNPNLVGIEFVTSWGSLGSSPGQFNLAHGIAINGSGYVYVADGGNNRIQVFTATGSFIRQWGSSGSGVGQFNNIRFIAINESGYVYVVDAYNHRIQVFTATGEYVRHWGGYGTSPGNFIYPWGIAINRTGEVYVADNWNKRIQVFTSTGAFIRQWGSNGSQNGAFNGPYEIDIDNMGFVYVTDDENQRVQKFTMMGEFITTWGSNGSENGEFRYPYGIAIAGSEYVLVTEGQNHRIQVFNTNGQYRTQWGNFGNGTGEFKNPQGIAINRTDYIYIVDSGNSRVQVFKMIKENFPDAPILEIITPNTSLTGNITLEWNDVVGATNYYVYRETSTITNITGLIPIATPTTSTYQDLGILNGTYYYAIIASNASGNSSLSNVESVVVAIPPINGNPPQAPVLGSITPNPSSTGNITLDWNDISGAMSYYVYRETATITSITGLTPIANPTISSYQDTNLPNGTYYYAIVASNASGNSSLSNVESVIVNILPPIEHPPVIPNSIILLTPINGSTYTSAFNISVTFELRGSSTFQAYWYQLNGEEWIRISGNTSITLSQIGKQSIQIKGNLTTGENITSLNHTFYLYIENNPKAGLEIVASTNSEKFPQGSKVQIQITLRNTGEVTINKIQLKFTNRYPGLYEISTNALYIIENGLDPGEGISYTIEIMMYRSMEMINLTGDLMADEYYIKLNLQIKADSSQESVINVGWTVGGAAGGVAVGTVAYSMLRKKKSHPPKPKMSKDNTPEPTMDSDIEFTF
jgi:nitrous oxidase accessory protein NosD